MRQYKKHLSDYPSWEPRSHADKWLIFPENLGPRLSIDESSLSRGELYTIVTNKDGHGGKGTLVAIIEGVKAVEVSRVLKKLPRQARHRVLEITLDMSGSMHAMIVFQKVCKSQIFYFCNGTIKNEYLWNLHMNKSRK